MAYANPRIRRLLLLILLLGFLLVILTRNHAARRFVDHRNREKKPTPNPPPPNPPPDKAMVIPKMRSDDVQWAYDMSDWHPYVYSTSDPPEPELLRVPALRGRETVTYLTFIIENYDYLPRYSAFIHASRDQWHNDILGAATSTILQNIRLDTVDRDGYVNLRCSLEPGCPVGVNPLAPTEIDIANNDTRAYFADMYMEIFDVPPSKIPEHIGNVCCAQFMVTKKRILERPLKDYERIREWAMHSNATDSFGVGWVMEKLWHILFGMPAIYCPPFEQCRCDLFGWCGPLPASYRPLVRSAHPWLGSVLGRKIGNDNAAGDWEKDLRKEGHEAP